MPAVKKRFKHRSSNKPQVRLLFTCIGRRVELLRAFQRAARNLNIGLEIHGADVNWQSPALHVVDKPHRVKPISDGRYAENLLSIVRRSSIDLLIPLIDHELPLLAAAADRFEAAGCRVLVSAFRVIQVCQDKLETYRMLKKAGIDTPTTEPWSKAVTRKKHRYPLFLKPRSGSAAMGNYVVNNHEELRVFGVRVPDAIVQEFVEGLEHTLDVYTGMDGRPRCVVPRKRLEVRSGEVSKGLIVKDRRVMDVGLRVAETLRDCRGVVTVQCIVSPDDSIRVIEINPRFGGGVPLSIHAGADFPKWILMELLERKPRINPNGFRDDVAMLRFDDSVFVHGASKRR